MELAIDTATRYAGAALSVDGVVRHEAGWHSANNHTAELATAVEGLLRDAGARARDLRSITAVVGPGGFSALRVGLGFAKGLAEALDIPIAAISALELEAAPHFDDARDDGALCPLIDVGRDRVAWRLYRVDAAGDWQADGGERVTPLAELLAAAPARATLCGEGAWRLREELAAQAGPGRRVVTSPPPTRSLAALAALGRRALADGLAVDRRSLEPNYLRPPSITMPPARPGAAPAAST